MRARTRIGIAIALSPLLASCTRFGPVYPSRPAPSQSAPVADPAPSRVVVHLTMTGAALSAALDDAVPRTGDGLVAVLGGDRRYTWDRERLDVGFAQGRITLGTRVRASVALPLHPIGVQLELRIAAEPVVTSEYGVKLQSVEVKVSSNDRGLAVADAATGVYDKLAALLTERLRGFSYDLKPLLLEAQTRVATPIDVPVGDAHGCAELRILGVEAGPTVLADGIEKDVALVVAPSVTLPCARAAGGQSSEGVTEEAPRPPPLENVASVPAGPFTVTIPIAASYDELTRAMTMAFTDGKLFFSTEYPELYLEKPELYESQGALVLKMHLHGPVHKLGIDADLDGDLYLSGHPAVIDNELALPDLEPTIETKSFLLSIKALTGSDRIRDQARAALRLDLGARLAPVREKLSSDLTFGDARGCFQGDVDRIAVTGVHPHAAYLRVYVEVTGRARITVPCASANAPQAPRAALSP
jgi:hypothetical protein